MTIKTRDVVSYVESRGEISAVRFEPKLYAKLEADASVEHPKYNALINAIASANRCTGSTARVIACTSYGAYQFLGMTLYSSPINFKGPILTYWSSAELQTLWFERFVASFPFPTDWADMVHNPNNLKRFARRYNGSTTYADALLTAAKKLGSES